jgi:DNA-binding response OmpR family regulator
MDAMRGNARILIVEDEGPILIGLEENLKAAGYDVMCAIDGVSALRAALENDFDLVILDLMLPRLSGYDVCRQLREKGRMVPVLMLTARQEEQDKLKGFAAGADDYVTKPFSIREVLARVRVILQRRAPSPEGPGRYLFGECVLDRGARVLERKGKTLALTPTEFDVMNYLCMHEGKALPRDQILTDIWGAEYEGTSRSLDNFITSLRNKVEARPAHPRHILTVHGVGYKFVNHG